MLHGVDWLQRTARQLAQPQGGQQTAGTALETLAARLVSPESDLQTRKAAVLSIKGLARDHPSLTASKALPALCSILDEQCSKASPPPATAARLGPEVQTWRELDEIARAALEAIIILCDPGSDVQKPNGQGPVKAGPGSGLPGAPRPIPASLQHADAFLVKPESLHALLPLLGAQHSFYTRFGTLQLLSLLLRARPAAVQAHTLSAPGGYAAILDCLAPQDPSTTAPGTGAGAPGGPSGGGAEIVRNEALLLLPLLVHANPDVQKLVAFEGAFERLLDVIAMEGRIEGGLIVQDALEGIESLLTNNVSNQNYFRETLSIPMLAPLLFYPPPLPPQAKGDRLAEADRQRQLDAFCFQQWDEQKILNARLVVGIGALLVGGQGEGRRLNQNAMATSNFTAALVHLALSSTAPPSLQAEALHALAAIFRASRTNQDLVAAFENVSPVVLTPASIPGQRPSWNRQAPRSVLLAILALAIYGPSSSSANSEQLKSEAPYYAVLPGSTPATASESAAVVQPGTQELAHVQPALAETVVKGPFFHLKLRTAALAAFEALVADNVALRVDIVRSMVTTSEASVSLTPGLLLLEALTKVPEPTSTTTPDTSDKSDQSKLIDPYVNLIASMVTAHLVRGSSTVKALARNLVFDVEGRSEWRDAAAATAIISSTLGGDASVAAANPTKSSTGADDEEEDERPSLIQTLIGTLTSSLRLQSDASRLDRASITLGGLAVGHTSATALWARVCAGLFTLLSVWCWDSPDDVRELLSESTNVQVLVQATVGGAAGGSGAPPSAPSLPTLSEPLLQSLAAYLLGIAYEFDTDPGQIAVDRATLFGILKARIGEDEFGTRVRRLKEDRRFASVGPDVLLLVGSGGSLGRSGAPSGTLAQLESQADAFVLSLANGAPTTNVPVAPVALAGGLGDDEWDGLWFDWPFVEAWKNNYVLIQKSILVDPASSSSNKASSSAELQDALRQVEMLRDQVTKAQREAEALQKTLAEERKERREEHDAHVRLLQEAEALTQSERDRITQLKTEHDTALSETQAQIDAMKTSLTSASTSARSHSTQLSAAQVELTNARAEVDRLEAERRQLDATAQAHLARLSEIEQAREQTAAEREQLRLENQRLEAELAQAKEAAATAASAPAPAPAGPAPGGASTSAAELEELKQRVESAEKRTAEIEKENEDLLVLLEELSTKRKADKAKLRAKGEEVSDDDEEDEDDHGGDVD